MESTGYKYHRFLPKYSARNTWKAFIFLIVGLCLTITIALYIERGVKIRPESEFALDCIEIKTKIDKRLHSQSQLLGSCSLLFAAFDTVTRNQWEKFNEPEQISKYLPGMQGVGFSLIIPKNQLQQHIQNLRKDGFPDYTIIPFGDREIYTSIVYFEPFHTFGYDMYSEPFRRRAMEQARDSDVAALSCKVILARETDKDLQTGTLMYVPVYRNGKPVNTVEERRAAIIGWVFSPYRMNDFMHGILGPWNQYNKNAIHLQVYDGDNISSDSLLFDSKKDGTLTHNDLTYRSLTLPVVFNGRKWTLCFSQSEEQSSYFKSGIIFILIIGIALSFLLFGLLLSFIRSKIRAIQLANQLISELKESEIKFKTVADFAYDWEYWEDEKDGQIIYMSPSCQRISGYKPSEFLADNLLMKKIIHPGDSKLLDNHFEKVHSTEFLHDTDEFDFRIIKKDGSVAYIGHLCTPVFDEKDNYLGRRTSNRDITRLKQSEELLRQSEEKFRKIVAEKDKLFSIITHDLSGSFIGFLGLTQTMAEELPSLTMAEIRKIAVNMRNSANNLSGLIENLLQWSRIQQGLIPFNPELVQLLPIVNENISTVLKYSKNKGIEIVYDIQDDIVVFADRFMLQTIIRNLVSNALTFTHKGGKISVSAKDADDSNIEISVMDSGLGMSLDMVDNLFGPDVQTGSKDIEGESGTRLGLQICMAFVEKQGGKIWVESEEGKGSVFYFTLPYTGKPDKTNVINNVAPVDKADSQFNPEVSGLKILIAEDDEGSASLMSITFKLFCKEILLVRTGVEAVDACRNNPDIDLVLMDIQMPDMDGYEATRQIRQFNTDVVIIAQTAYALNDDQLKSIAAGCNDFIAKPMTKDQLLGLLKKYFKK